MRNSLAIGIGTLRANPLRTLLSTLGIIMGVASLVAVLAVGDGVERFAREQLARTTDLQSVVAQPLTTRQVDGVRLPNPGYPVFTLADADSVAALMPPGSVVELGITGSARLEAAAFDRVRAAIVAGRLRFGDSLAGGRPFSPEESRSGAHVAIVSRLLADSLASGTIESVIGDTIRLEGTRFRVIGVARGYRGERGFAVTVPFAAASAALAAVAEPRATPLVVSAERLEGVQAVRAALESWLARRVPSWKSFVAIQSNALRLEQAEQGVLIFKLLMGTITGISLLVGGIGIMNVLLAAVAERTREIGVRKAVGARRFDILVQFLAESATITAMGSVLGAALGVALAFLATAVMRARVGVVLYAAFRIESVVLACLVAVGVGLLFGMYPAMRAARLDPIEAIRHE